MLFVTDVYLSVITNAIFFFSFVLECESSERLHFLYNEIALMPVNGTTLFADDISWALLVTSSLFEYIVFYISAINLNRNSIKPTDQHQI